MKEQRRRSAKAILALETLDERIVPSAITFTHPMGQVASAEHSQIQVRVHHRHRLHARHPATVPLSTGVQLTNPVTAPNDTGAATPATPATPVTPATPLATGSGTRAIEPPSSAPAIAPTFTVSNDPLPTTPSPDVVKNGPLAKAGQTLISIYEEYQQQGAGTTFTSSQAGFVLIQGTNVGVDIQSAGGDFNAFVSQLTKLGMQVRATDAAHGTVEGLLPIAQIPTVAQNPDTLDMSPISRPQLSGGLL